MLKIAPASDSAFIVYLDMPLGEASAWTLRTLQQQLLSSQPQIIKEVVLSYLSLLVEFDPFEANPFDVKSLITKTFQKIQSNQDNSQSSSNKSQQRIVDLPVYYDESVGPDLTRIATEKGLSIEDVIKLHQQTLYTVFAIGFAPGFAYLGEVDKRIAMPRLSSPRKKIAKGSVAIADRQTAIYPAASPGGWNIIGRCPTVLFEPTKTPSMPFSSGDKIRFTAISKQEFVALGGEL